MKTKLSSSGKSLLVVLFALGSLPLAASAALTPNVGYVRTDPAAAWPQQLRGDAPS